MSHYVDLELNYTTYVEIVDNLRECVNHKESYWEIEDIVHLIDFLEEEYESDRNKQNREFAREREYRKIFAEETVGDYDLGMLVVKEMKKLIGYEPFDDAEFQFRNAMMVIDAIREEYDIIKKSENE